MNFRTIVTAALFVMPAAALAQDTEARPARAEGNTVGIGIGWVFPQDLLEPNTASARFRLGRITLEPSINLGGSSGTQASTTRTTVPGAEEQVSEDEDKSSSLDVTVGAQVRYALASRGPVDLVVLGGVGFGYGSATVDQDVNVDDQVNRTTTSNQNVGANWGLGVEWFLGKGLSLSADAVNPLVSWSQSRVRQEREQPGPFLLDGETKSTTLSGGLTFRPTVRVMVHLYF
jgi:opacity protein-like surface antigen